MVIESVIQLRGKPACDFLSEVKTEIKKRRFVAQKSDGLKQQFWSLVT